MPSKNNCVEFQGYKWASGYGCKWYKGRNIGAHRYAWLTNIGPIPEGIYVCHKCDNRACINIDHLFLGTCQDNIKDMVAKGRQGKGYTWKKKEYKGEKHHSAKLTDAQVIEIKNKDTLRKGVSKLAKEYGISRKYIPALIKGDKRNEC